jgi:transglutaminase-like putative cysteine protease
LDLAWTLFKDSTPGWARVQAICDFVHQRINFGYEHARVTRTASEAYQEGQGVCRDYAHLAVAFCRALNIPARYCTGYLGDVGTPPPFSPGDFAAWFEAYLGGQWYTFDARNNVPDWQGVTGPGTGCRRCSDHNNVRPQYPLELSGLDG